MSHLPRVIRQGPNHFKSGLGDPQIDWWTALPSTATGVTRTRSTLMALPKTPSNIATMPVYKCPLEGTLEPSSMFINLETNPHSCPNPFPTLSRVSHHFGYQ